MVSRALAILSIATALGGVVTASARASHAASEPDAPRPRVLRVATDTVEDQIAPTAAPRASRSAAGVAPAAARVLASEPRLRFVWPIVGRITSPFGERVSPVTGEHEVHGGADIACSTGDPIVASSGGSVILGGRIPVFGNAVAIRDDQGWVTFYAHMDTLSVYGGKTVAQGEVIGTCGSSGRATGPHLHFQIRRPSGNAIDPLSVLPAGKN